MRQTFYINSNFERNYIIITLYPTVMSVNSLENVRSEKDFLISQQDESDQALMSAVSFPASVLRGDPSTGKI